MRIALLGNLADPHSTENHHLQALTDLGHEVIPLQERATAAAALAFQARRSDLLVWVHTHGWKTPGGIDSALQKLRRAGIPTIAYHLDLWHGLARQKDLGGSYFQSVQHFFTVDLQMADWITHRTPAQGHYLPAAVAHRECWMAPADNRDLDVIFVGSHRYHPEWPYRNRLLLALTERYGQSFHVYPGAGRPVRGAALNRLYGRSKVVVGDSLCPNFDYLGYWSDRVYETLGRGGMLIHPRVPGLDDQFRDGEHLVYYDYQDFDGLFDRVDHHLNRPDAADTIRRQGHAEVHRQHTYLHRWQTILETIA